MISLANQVVLVTGAGRGLGAAYAELLARRGATVVVHDGGVERDGTGGDPEVAESVANAIRAEGGRAEAATQNLATRAACEELVSTVLSEHGRLDALVHNAGIVRYAGIVDTPEGEMTPESVAPAVVMLASDQCRWSGQVLVAQDGEFGFDRTARIAAGPAGTPEDVLRLAARDASDLAL